MSLRVMRWIASGALLCGMVLLSNGCGKAARGQWPSSRLNRVHKPTDRGPTTFAPDVEQSQYNMQALDGLPSGVQASFVREHPSAAITSVQQIPNGSGLMLYRVAYLEDGVSGFTTYRASGTDMAPPPSIIIRGDDYGRPPVRYAPSTQPAQETKYEQILAPRTAQ